MNKETQKLIIFIIISGALLFGFNYFYAPKVKPAENTAASSAIQPPATASAAAPLKSAGEKMMSSEIRTSTAKLYTVENKLAIISFTNEGGSISSFKLKKYNDTTNNKIEPLEMIPARSVSTYLSLYSVERDLVNSEWKYEGTSQASFPIVISFSKEIKPGVKIIKEYYVPEDSYMISVKLRFVNKSGAPYAFKDMQYSWGPNIHFLPSELVHQKSGVGGSYNKVTYLIGKSQKTVNTNLKSKENKTTVLDGIPEWIGVKDLYFTAALKPQYKVDIKSAVIKDEIGGFVYVGLNLRDILVNSGAEDSITVDTYVGPAEYKRLNSFGMAKLVDLGGIRFLGEWMFFGLDYIYKLTKNYGVAILILTLLIRLILWIPSNSSFKQMKQTQSKMAVIKPRMETLKKIYKDDPTKLNEETMKLYQEYKINPFGGCLPMLLQLPIFISLYATLINVVELKGANFGFWLHDLSIPDPYYVLPIFMGVTMLIQQKMSAQPSMNEESDFSQKLMLYGMPIFLTWMSFSWPAGLMLYWSISNVLGIAQQVLVNQSK
jgi:YidC/Oxa1 family membrane protein insertase